MEINSGEASQPDASIVLSKELSEEEQNLRLHLERKVERSFFEWGSALMELCNKRLYRSTHKTFDEYVLDVFGYSPRQAYYLIEAAKVVDNLLSESERIVQILPANEWQVRPLTKLEPEEQRICWQVAVEESKGKVPSGKTVRDVVQRIMKRTKVPNTYNVGEVCQILPKENPELKGKSKCWCIISAVNDFSCTVTTWDGEYTIRVEHLKSFNYLDTDCANMQQISERIKKLRENPNIEEAAIVNLKHLGELKRPYLTELEEGLLNFLEQKYGVTNP